MSQNTENSFWKYAQESGHYGSVWGKESDGWGRDETFLT